MTLVKNGLKLKFVEGPVVILFDSVKNRGLFWINMTSR